jgi:hypothetical protein
MINDPESAQCIHVSFTLLNFSKPSVWKSVPDLTHHFDHTNSLCFAFLTRPSCGISVKGTQDKSMAEVTARGRGRGRGRKGGGKKAAAVVSVAAEDSAADHNNVNTLSAVDEVLRKKLRIDRYL